VSEAARVVGPADGPVRPSVAVGLATTPPVGGSAGLLLAAADAGLRQAMRRRTHRPARAA
jgi:hypothetical protein